MSHILTVSQFVDLVNAAFDSLGPIAVEGEVSDYKVIHNKWVTFSLKDAESTVPCFMTVWQLRTQIEDGMLVRVIGKPALRNKGFFSFVLQNVIPSGEGALKRAFELLQQKLANEGLFAQERKRPLPKFPEHISLITSREAAAYTDFIKVLRERQGGLHISFIHTQVQGDDAPRQLIDALNTANTELQDLDVIVMVRGGGSLEDLQAFNDESVIRAVAASRTPIIVGVGHERDITLAELAADVRASTPSNAAELLVRSREELTAQVQTMTDRLNDRVQETIDNYQSNITHGIHALEVRFSSTRNEVLRRIDVLHGTYNRFQQEIVRSREYIIEYRRRLVHGYSFSLTHTDQKLKNIHRVLASLSPSNVLKRGFSITKDAQGYIIKHSKQLKPGDEVTTTLLDGSVTSNVTRV